MSEAKAPIQERGAIEIYCDTVLATQSKLMKSHDYVLVLAQPLASPLELPIR
jgi:hypothetical protein